MSSKYGTRKKEIDFAKIGEKLSLTGANCHYCKTIMTVKESNACRFTLIKNKLSTTNGNSLNNLNLNVLEEKEGKTGKESSKTTKKKTCNKKFCYDCLSKHFPSFWETRNNRDWKCPCCCNKCTCKQCQKIILKGFNKEKKETDDLEKDSQGSVQKEKQRIFNRNLVLNSLLNEKVGLIRFY